MEKLSVVIHGKYFPDTLLAETVPIWLRKDAKNRFKINEHKDNETINKDY